MGNTIRIRIGEQQGSTSNFLPERDKIDSGKAEPEKPRCLLCIAAQWMGQIRELKSYGEELLVSTDIMTKMAENTIESWYRAKIQDVQGNNLNCEKFILTGLRGSGKSAYLKRLHKRIQDVSIDETQTWTEQPRFKRFNNEIYFIDFKTQKTREEWEKELCNPTKIKEKTFDELEKAIRKLLKSACGNEKPGDLAKKKNLFLWIDNWEFLLNDLIVERGAYAPNEGRLLTKAIVDVLGEINKTCNDYTRGGVCISISSELRKSVFRKNDIKGKFYNTRDFWGNPKNTRTFLEEYIKKSIEKIGTAICDGCIVSNKTFGWSTSNMDGIIDKVMNLQQQSPDYHPTKMIYALSHACGAPNKKGEDNGNNWNSKWDKNIKNYYTTNRKPDYLTEQLSLIYICCGSELNDKRGRENQGYYSSTASEALMDQSGIIHSASETKDEWIERLKGFENEKLRQRVFQYLVDAYILVPTESKDKYEINPFLIYLYSEKSLQDYMGGSEK